jgi:hypothetical protein
LAALAAASTSRTCSSLASHGVPAGSPLPLNPNVNDTCPTFAPLTSTIVGVLASSALRAEPVCLMPAASRMSNVLRTPFWPRSSVWLDAVEHRS